MPRQGVNAQFLQYLIVFTGGGLSVTFLFPVLFGLYWSRFNRAGAYASMLARFGCYLALYGAGYVLYGAARPVRPLGFDPLLWGFAASSLAGVAACLATPPPAAAISRRFFAAGSVRPGG